ncbi:MAG: sterol desaturase family protein [Bacteroidota bacterium]
MEKYIDLALDAYRNYGNYLWNDIANPQWRSYFYLLIFVSLVFFVLEVLLPWRKKQAIFRKDFFLDLFYMFFNFFLFSLVIFSAASTVVVDLFNDGISWLTGGFDLQASNPLRNWPLWAILLTGFVVRDFVQWWIHRLLHSTEWLWNFHKVHHSVEEMGFAAHLRYHWMETVVYRSLEYIPLALLGIGLYDFFVIHLFTLAWGHYNHANLRLPFWFTGGVVGGLIGLVVGSGSFEVRVFGELGFWGGVAGAMGGFGAGAILLRPIMPYLFNSPEMHLWHHVKELPEGHPHGINYGLTLSVWYYLFGTDYLPLNQGDISLGFPGVEAFPKGFSRQVVVGTPLEK